MPTDSQASVKMWTRSVGAATFAVFFSTLSSSAAVKQVGAFGPWQLMCAAEVKVANDCAIVQATVDPRTHRDARIALSFANNGNLRLLLKMWNVYGEPKEVSLLADGTQIDAIPLKDCGEHGCKATVSVDENLAQYLSASRRFVLAASVSEREGAYSSFDTEHLKPAIRDLYKQVGERFGVPTNPAYSALLSDQPDFQKPAFFVPPSGSSSDRVATVGGRGVLGSGGVTDEQWTKYEEHQAAYAAEKEFKKEIVRKRVLADNQVDTIPLMTYDLSKSYSASEASDLGDAQVKSVFSKKGDTFSQAQGAWIEDK